VIIILKFEEEVVLKNFVKAFDFNIPAIEAVIKHARLPPIILKKQYFVKKIDFDGHKAVNVAICTPTDPKFEKPHSAYVAMTIDFSLNFVVFKIKKKKIKKGTNIPNHCDIAWYC
jgi:hypothetical protein